MIIEACSGPLRSGWYDGKKQLIFSMQILSAEQIRAWDQYTITRQPIPSLELMEQAAQACLSWLVIRDGYDKKSFAVCCGKGNNGGDGLAIARLLLEDGLQVDTYILEFGNIGTEDFQANLARLRDTGASIHFLTEGEALPTFPAGKIIIDALFGSGLNRPLTGQAAALVQQLNISGNEIISIDMPSGLSADFSSKGNIIVTARHTLSFQCYKPALLMPENAKQIGQVHILDIGLHPGFLKNIRPAFEMVDEGMVRSILRPRSKFAHKGDFGHAALIAGSLGMMGAGVLAARACIHSGVGKLSCHTIKAGYTTMQVAVPEAMCVLEPGKHYIESVGAVDRYDAIGIGPGLGNSAGHGAWLADLLSRSRQPMVIDADGLNTLAQHPALLEELPPGGVLTPHPKEFERLFGESANDFERVRLAQERSARHKVVIVLKGAYSFIATPGGMGYFNSTGNPGMATGGTGDVLTGIVLGLLTQGYPAEQAAIAAVYLHGLAGDMAAASLSQEFMTASDLIHYLGAAFIRVSGSDRND